MSIATAVLVWGDPDDPIDPIDPIDPDDPDDTPLTEAELNAPFKIDVVPSQPLINDVFDIKIYAHDSSRWRISSYGPDRSTVDGVATWNSGGQETDIVALNGSSDISTSYPVSWVDRITCASVLFNADTGRSKPAGSGLYRSDYSVINGKIVLASEASYYGLLEIEYRAVRYTNHPMRIRDAGIYYFDCYVHNSTRREIIKIEITNEDIVVQTVTIRDYCTDEVIPGATVVIAGQTLTADANGNIVLNGIASGQTLPVVITASGYHDSDADTLNNDTITT